MYCIAGGVDWKSLVEKRDAYVERLNGIYAREDLATKAVNIHLPHQYLQSANQWCKRVHNPYCLEKWVILNMY
jgi:hypothetical protein